MFAEMNLVSGSIIAVLALFAEYVDSTLGMGYGTTLTPILLLMGFEPLHVVPAVLLSELMTGLLAGAAHHAVGNADFGLKLVRGSGGSAQGGGRSAAACIVVPVHLKVAMVIAACSVVGTLVAVFAAVSINKLALRIYIGLLVTAMGAFILFSRRKSQPFSWRRITFCGLLASFNKGLSGGGYGPVVTGGQILAGMPGNSAVAITSVAEGLTCVVGFLAYLLITGIQDWTLMPYLCVGAVLSVPLSAVTVKRIGPGSLKIAIGILTLLLGLLTLGKTIL